MKRLLLVLLLSLVTWQFVHAQEDFMWGKQFGTNMDDKPRSLATDLSGNIFIFGKTKGALGDSLTGGEDGFVVKIDELANIVWETQLGTKDNDDLLKGVTDHLGNLYVTGYSEVNGEQHKNKDILVVKISGDGEIVWQKQFGTENDDQGVDIDISGNGDIYVIGQTKGLMGEKSYGDDDCIILRLDNEGSQIKAVQIGTPATDIGSGIFIKNDSTIYICGSTAGELAGVNAGALDVFCGVISNELEVNTLMQHGSADVDFPSDLLTDINGNIYIAGSTRGNMGAEQLGNGDCFVQKLNKNGEVLWSRQFGTSNWDGVNGLNIYDENSIIISGCTNYPNCESFCRIYDSSGNLLWGKTHVLQGAGGGTCGKGICIDSKGYIFHTGYTGANMFSGLKGEHDIFVVKFKLDDIKSK